MTKNKFVKRLMRNNPVTTSDITPEMLDLLVVAIFEEIKEVIREGDELRIKDFGKFYRKNMQARVVRGGWYQDEKKAYSVPEKSKIGFSSFPAVDRYVSQRPVLNLKSFNEDLFGDY